MSSQDFMFLLDLKSSFRWISEGKAVLLHCSPSQIALRTNLVLLSSFGLLTHFSVHQFPEKKFALLQQARTTNTDADNLLCHSYNLQHVLPSLSPTQRFVCWKGPRYGTSPRPKALQSCKMMGFLPILGSFTSEKENCAELLLASPSWGHDSAKDAV